MKKPKREPRPTEYETKILRRIAQNGGAMTLTFRQDRPAEYADLAGIAVPSDTAKAFIRNGWLESQRDSMFDLTPQSWRVKGAIPGSGGGNWRSIGDVASNITNKIKER